MWGLYIFFCISDSVGGIFLIIHVCDSTPILFEGRKFSHDRSLIKGTLHEEQCTFWAEFRHAFEGFS